MTAAGEITSAGLRTTIPSAVTRPAAIAACARARLSNRPRATSRRSARSRVVMVLVGWALRPFCVTAWAKSFGAMPTPRRHSDDFTHPTVSGELHCIAAQVLPERFECLGNNTFGVEAGLGIHGVGRVLVDEQIRQHHRADFQAA